jgi:hypothetical protein
MKVDTAVDLINGLTYLPGWKITARDDTNRFEGSVNVRIAYPAVDTDRENAKVGYEKKIETYAEFRFIVLHCPDQNAVIRKVLDKIMVINLHETREALRVLPSLDAPFHPHSIDGMEAWGDVEGDLLFGVK